MRPLRASTWDLEMYTSVCEIGTPPTDSILTPASKGHLFQFFISFPNGNVCLLPIDSPFLLYCAWMSVTFVPSFLLHPFGFLLFFLLALMFKFLLGWAFIHYSVSPQWELINIHGLNIPCMLWTQITFPVIKAQWQCSFQMQLVHCQSWWPTAGRTCSDSTIPPSLLSHGVLNVKRVSPTASVLNSDWSHCGLPSSWSAPNHLEAVISSENPYFTESLGPAGLWRWILHFIVGNPKAKNCFSV